MDGKAESAATAGAVTIERRESIALLQFSAPSRVNALSVPVMRDLIAACRTFEDDARTAAIVIAGRDTIFSAGLDLRSDETRAMAEGGLEERRALADTGRRLLQALADLAPVTVAAVEGPCLGGGLALAAALDFRVAARSAVFGAPEVGVGLSMGWGSLAHLSAIAGVQVARRLVLAAERLTASEALAAGLVDRLAEDGRACQQAFSFCRELASLPVAPLRMAKRALAAMVTASGIAVALDTDQFVASASSDGFSGALDRYS